MPTEQALYYFSAHAHCCAFNDGAVILDARSGRYLGIDSRQLPALIAHIADWPGQPTLPATGEISGFSESERLMLDLLERGILTKTASQRPVAYLVPPLTSMSAIGRSPLRHSIRLSHRILFIMALLRVLLMRRKDRLEPIIHWLRQQSNLANRSDSKDSESIIQLLHSFEHTRMWFYSARKHCLLDSFVLSVYLSLARRPCHFVIAVATKPFLAHSWVQIDDAVLNDTVENVQVFHPILVIG